MAKRRGGKNTKQPLRKKRNCDHDVDPVNKKEESFQGHEVERQIAAVRAVRDMEIEQLQTTLVSLKSNFSKEQLRIPVLEFFMQNFPNLSISESSKDGGQCEVKWSHEQNLADEKTLHASLLHRLSMAYPDYTAGIRSITTGFDFSNKSVKTGIFGVDKLQIRSLVFEEPFDSQITDGLQTPNVSNNRSSVGITPKTVRLPKCGEMLLSVHGSPLGVYKEDNMETIQETEDD